MANRTIKKNINPRITQANTFVSNAFVCTFELGLHAKCKRFKRSLIFLSSGPLSSGPLSSSPLSTSSGVLDQNSTGSSTPSRLRSLLYAKFCALLSCDLQSILPSIRNVSIITGILVLCLFGPLSCNRMILSDLISTPDQISIPATKQQPSDSPSTEDSGKTQQSKPDKLFNSMTNSAYMSDRINLQHAEISTEFASKTLTGHSLSIFGLFLFKTKLSNGASIELASIDKGGNILLWDFQSRGTTAYESIKVREGFTAISFNSKKLRLAVAYPGEINVFSLRDKKRYYQLTRLKTRVGSLDFNKEGDSLVMGGADGVVYNWRFEFEEEATAPSEKEKSFQRYIGHSSVVNHVRFHPFGRVFFSTDWFGVVSAWLTYQSDAYSGDYDKNALQGQIFTLESDRVNAARVETDIIDSFEISDSGEFIYLVSEKGKIQVWMVRGFKLAAEIEGHKGTVYGMAVNPRGDLLVTIGRDGYMRVWQLVEQETDVRGVRSYILEKRDEREDHNVRTLKFLDNNRLVAGNSSGKLIEIDLSNYGIQSRL